MMIAELLVREIVRRVLAMANPNLSGLGVRSLSSNQMNSSSQGAKHESVRRNGHLRGCRGRAKLCAPCDLRGRPGF